jgi:hypothetical protein
MPGWRRSASHQNQKQPFESRVLRQMFLSNLMLSCTLFTVNDRYPMLLTISPNPATESPGHPHQMFVIQILITPVQVSPPQAKTTGNVSPPEIRIQNDAVRAIINSIKQFGVTLAQVIHLLFHSFIRLVKGLYYFIFCPQGLYFLSVVSGNC